MKTTLSPVEKELMGAVNYLPCVSLLMPFEPKVSLKSELDYRLKVAAGKIEKALKAGYTEEKAAEVIRRLHALIDTLDFDSSKKSIAIYVSPLLSKVYYLDIPVEEKIIMDESFEIRDLVYSQKTPGRYLVLVLSSEQSRLYLGNHGQFIRIPLSLPENAMAYQSDPPERVANFSDPARRKEILMDKFLHHIDEGLQDLLKKYPLPLFVMGTDRTAGHFKKMTRHGSRVTAYVHGNYGEASEAQLHKILEPYREELKKNRERDLLKQLDSARSAGKLAIGMEEVWKEAMHHNGRLLVVEKNYIFPAQQGDRKDLIYPWDERIPNDLYIKDAVDDVIEKVMTHGGDVEFTEEGMLKDYQKIALVEFYNQGH